MNATIRRLDAARVDDYRHIRLAALAGAPDAFGSTHAVEVERPRAHFQSRLDGSNVFGAFRGDIIVGMAGLLPEVGATERHKGMLWGMYVQPGERGRGTARDLLHAVFDAARTLGIEQVLLTVTHDNVAARCFYEREGFVAYGTEPRALKRDGAYQDEVLMLCFLADNANDAQAR